jgi:hypothetical protein
MTGFRGTFRMSVQVALIAAELIPPQNVLQEADWAQPDIALPAISINIPRFRYEDRSIGVGVPQFWSTIYLGLDLRLQNINRQTLIWELDTLIDSVEAIMVGFIIGPPQIGFRRISDEIGEINFSAEGTQHIAAANLVFGFEYPNDGEPVITDRLTEMCLRMIERATIGSSVGQALIDILAGANIQIPQPAL